VVFGIGSTRATSRGWQVFANRRVCVSKNMSRGMQCARTEMKIIMVRVRRKASEQCGNELEINSGLKGRAGLRLPVLAPKLKWQRFKVCVILAPKAQFEKHSRLTASCRRTLLARCRPRRHLGQMVGVLSICRDGEIGRRSGLKIRRAERPVGVRFPLPAPTITICSAFVQRL
jgi:hypothetical protein